MSSGILRHAFRRRRDGRINEPPMERSRGLAYVHTMQERTAESGSQSTVATLPAKEVTMKVQTDLKAGGGSGILGVVIVDVDVDIDISFGGGCGRCGGGKKTRC